MLLKCPTPDIYLVSHLNPGTIQAVILVGTSWYNPCSSFSSSGVAILLDWPSPLFSLKARDTSPSCGNSSLPDIYPSEKSHFSLSIPSWDDIFFFLKPGSVSELFGNHFRYNRRSANRVGTKNVRTVWWSSRKEYLWVNDLFNPFYKFKAINPLRFDRLLMVISQWWMLVLCGTGFRQVAEAVFFLCWAWAMPLLMGSGL